MLKSSAQQTPDVKNLFQGVLIYPRYLVNLTFSGLEIVDKHFNIEDIVFTISTYNPQFTHMEVTQASKVIYNTEQGNLIPFSKSRRDDN